MNSSEKEKKNLDKWISWQTQSRGKPKDCNLHNNLLTFNAGESSLNHFIFQLGFCFLVVLESRDKMRERPSSGQVCIVEVEDVFYVPIKTLCKLEMSLVRFMTIGNGEDPSVTNINILSAGLNNHHQTL